MTALQEPIELTIGTPHTGSSQIDQQLVFTGSEEGKLIALRNIIHDGLKPPVLIFLQSKVCSNMKEIDKMVIIMVDYRIELNNFFMKWLMMAYISMSYILIARNMRYIKKLFVAVYDHECFSHLCIA